MSATECKKSIIEWEMPAACQLKVARHEEIEIVEAIEEAEARPRREVVIVVDGRGLAAAAGAAALPVSGGIVAVVYFETIAAGVKMAVVGACLVLKWAGLLVVFVLVVFVLGNILKHMATISRQQRECERHPGWSTGRQRQSETTIIQSAGTIINNFKK